MTSHVRPTPLTDALYDYVLGVSLREPECLRALREETATLSEGEWQTAPEQGPVLSLLLKLLDARRVLEVGTFTGYGTLWMALAMPADGKIVTCDVNEDYAAIARKHWQRAGVADLIDLRLAPALETLADLREQGAEFDFTFIDADKENYLAYYEQCLALTRPGGLVCVDNTLWDGRPADLANQEASTLGIRALNQALRDDPRVDLCFLPMADGMTLARKLGSVPNPT